MHKISYMFGCSLSFSNKCCLHVIVKTQKRVETLVESGVDCITSSYGVGPTDERGRPLFGLRALRRSNTNKQLTGTLVHTFYKFFCT